MSKIRRMDEDFEKKVVGTDATKPVREMTELEIYGARYLMYKAYLDWCNEMGTEPSNFEDVEGDWYVCSNALYTSDYMLTSEEGMIVMSSVFCIEGSTCLYGWAYNYDEWTAWNEGGRSSASIDDEPGEPALFLVRVN
jgi:hypothetical protein